MIKNALNLHIALHFSAVHAVQWCSGRIQSSFFCSLHVSSVGACLGHLALSVISSSSYAMPMPMLLIAACSWQRATDWLAGWQLKSDFERTVTFNLHETMQHSVNKFSGYWILGCMYKNLQWQRMSSFHDSCFYRHDMCACRGQVDKHMHTVTILGSDVWWQMAWVNRPETHRRYTCDIAKRHAVLLFLQKDWSVLFWMLLLSDLWIWIFLNQLSMIIDKNWRPHCDSSLPLPLDSDITKRMGGPGIQAVIVGTEAASFQRKRACTLSSGGNPSFSSTPRWHCWRNMTHTRTKLLWNCDCDICMAESSSSVIGRPSTDSRSWSTCSDKDRTSKKDSQFKTCKLPLPLKCNTQVPWLIGRPSTRCWWMIWATLWQAAMNSAGNPAALLAPASAPSVATKTWFIATRSVRKVCHLSSCYLQWDIWHVRLTWHGQSNYQDQHSVNVTGTQRRTRGPQINKKKPLLLTFFCWNLESWTHKSALRSTPCSFSHCHSHEKPVDEEKSNLLGHWPITSLHWWWINDSLPASSSFPSASSASGLRQAKSMLIITSLSVSQAWKMTNECQSCHVRLTNWDVICHLSLSQVRAVLKGSCCQSLEQTNIGSHSVSK